MRADLQRLIRKRSQTRSLHVNHAILVLQRTFCKDEFTARDHQAISLIEIGCDDHVGDAGLVFHRKEDEPFCRAGPLASDDATGSPHKFAIFASAQFCCRKNVLHAKLMTTI